MTSSDDVRDYYSMPEGEVPVTPYERSKVSDLSRRIRSEVGEKRSSDLHIIAGRKMEQVRRIACLTALDLLNSGTEVIPFRENGEYDGKDPGKRPVYLIDESHFQYPGSDEGGGKSVLDAIDAVKERTGKNHAIILSLSQETYDRDFQGMPGT